MTTLAASSGRTTATWRRALLVLPLVATAALGLGLAWHTPSDLDLPLHDRAGRDLLAGGGILHTNSYSFTAPDHVWVNHEWAFQVAVAAAGNLAVRGDTPATQPPVAPHPAIERAVGWQALHLLLTALLLGAVALMWRRDLAGGQPPAASLVLLGPVALLALAMLWTRLILRPELVSAALLLLVLGRIEACLRDADPAARPWRLLLDPRQPGGQALLLTVLWYQVHGFALLAAVLWLLAGLAGRSPMAPARRWQLTGAGLGLALVAGLATPGGPRQLLYPLRVLAQFGDAGLDLQATISEMVPLLETRDSLYLTLLAFKVSLAWAAVWIVAAWQGLSRLRLALFVLALLAAWQAQRNLGFYALAFLLLHGDLDLAGKTTLARRLAGRFPATMRRRATTTLAILVPITVTATATVWFLDLASDRFYLGEGVARRWGAGLAPANYPLDQAAALAALGPRRTANNVNAASTLIAAGAGPVAIDGRTEAYPASAWRDYRDLLAGQARARQRLRDWQAEAICLAHRTPSARPLLRTLLDDGAWTVTSADEAGVLLLPAGSETAAALPGTPAVLREAASRLRREFEAAPPGRHVRLADRGVALAALLQTANLPDLAEDLLGLSVARCPDHPAAHHNLGNLLLARGDLRGALPRFEAAGRLNRNSASPLVNAGNCLFQLGRPGQAARTLARATARDPDNFEAWANLAEVRRQMGDRRGAARAYERALELRPDDQRLRARASSL